MFDLSLLTELSSYGTATLLESGPDVKMLPRSISPLYTPLTLVGEAFTVSALPGDNLSVHLALADAPPGSVLVVSMGGDTTHGFWGEIMTEAAMARGIVGLVTDGAVRDTREIRSRGFPVFCGGICIRGSKKMARGSSEQVISLSGTAIENGEVVVGDDDGVVVVSPSDIPVLLDRARARHEMEQAIMTRIRHGELTLDLLNLRNRSG
jgi:4-hydroxy-4-methyl-2-oxoglutarate aldolase